MLTPILTMAPPRVIRVTRVGSPPVASGEVMSRLRRVRGLLDATEEYPRRLAGRWAWPLFVLSFLAIVYCTLFPFNFKVPLGMTLRQAAAVWDWRIFDPSDRLDFLDNVVLFLPFGFAVACLARSLGASNRWLTPASLCSAAIFSTSIEILQLWLPTRDSALADVIANTAGGFLGGALFAARGAYLLVRGGYGLLALRRALNLPVCVVLMLMFMASALIGPWHLRHRGRELSSWDSNYLLALGGEPQDSRNSWQGAIDSLDLANASLSPKAVAQAYQGKTLAQLLPGAIQYSYVPSGSFSYADQLGHGPPLQWSVSKSAEAAHNVIGPGSHYFASSRPLTEFNQSVATGPAFTARVVVQSGRIYQGPDRIIASICEGARLTNFALMQDRADLVVHLRTILGGYRPVWIVPDVFARPGPHDILITYQQPLLRVYVDSATSVSAVNTPVEFGQVARYVPRFERLPLKGFGLEIYRVLYYFVSFMPIGLLVGVVVADPRVSQKIRNRIAIAGILGPLLIMQGMLLIVDRWTPRADNILLNILVPSLAMALMVGWLAPEQITLGFRTAANVFRRRGR